MYPKVVHMVHLRSECGCFALAVLFHMLAATPDCEHASDSTCENVDNSDLKPVILLQNQFYIGQQISKDGGAQPAAASQGRGYKQTTDTYCSGNPGGLNPDVYATKAACQAACDRNDKCVAYDWHDENKWCVLADECQVEPAIGFEHMEKQSEQQLLAAAQGGAGSAAAGAAGSRSAGAPTLLATSSEAERVSSEQQMAVMVSTGAHGPEPPREEELEHEKGPSDDSCLWAKDNNCDEPRYCDVGTDCTDCGTCDVKSQQKPAMSVIETTQSCEDLEWRDMHGDDCTWYAEGTHCQQYGKMFPNNGSDGQKYDAQTACCSCGGGRQKKDVVIGECRSSTFGCCPDGLKSRTRTGSNCDAALMQTNPCGTSEFGCCHDGTTPRINAEGKNCRDIGPFHCGETLDCRTCFYGDASCPNWHVTAWKMFTPDADGFQAYCRSLNGGAYTGGNGACANKCRSISGCWKDYYGTLNLETMQGKKKRPQMQELAQNYGCDGDQKFHSGAKQGMSTGATFRVIGDKQVTFFYLDGDSDTGEILDSPDRIQFGGNSPFKWSLYKVPCADSGI